jgi:hypothetical protein
MASQAMLDIRLNLTHMLVMQQMRAYRKFREKIGSEHRYCKWDEDRRAVQAKELYEHMVSRWGCQPMVSQWYTRQNHSIQGLASDFA